KELDRRYFGMKLPHKFKFGVTGCRNNCLKAEENDVGIKGACEVTWLADPCIMCGICERGCPTSAISSTETEIIVDYNLCISCGKCAKHCPTDSWETRPGYAVFFGGQFGNTIEKGKTNIPIVKDEEQLYRVTDAAINYFKEHGKRKERLGKLFERVGRKDFDELVQAAYNGS
ncbi:MAG: 4Fe-4S binding protein, partial [Eggerthellaceae bacterium]|nr:4Fe-4S binding protein [Eggerthellaceae bacterium]